MSFDAAAPLALASSLESCSVWSSTSGCRSCCSSFGSKRLRFIRYGYDYGQTNAPQQRLRPALEWPSHYCARVGGNARCVVRSIWREQTSAAQHSLNVPTAATDRPSVSAALDAAAESAARAPHKHSGSAAAGAPPITLAVVLSSPPPPSGDAAAPGYDCGGARGPSTLPPFDLNLLASSAT